MWCSVDLRDGNQALIEPMDIPRKLRMFQTLVAIGFKEIEVGFPSASQVEFDFVRKLIDEDLIPDDVTIQVLTQAREPLIRRTFEVAAGRHARHRAPVQRHRAGDAQGGAGPGRGRHRRTGHQPGPAVRGTGRAAAADPTGPSSTRPRCSRAPSWPSPSAWSMPSPRSGSRRPQRKCIVNLPSTVEHSTPNIFADMIEWMHRNLARRDSIVLSVHPHNDRGTGTAAGEFAVMAGADRLEGCLFGNGERTGNLDLVNVALNLYSQGVDPGLDFSDIDEIRRTVEHCNQLPVHPRHPYAGDLVYTSFSGSHQDAIKKAFAARKEGDIWDMPYLPLDPKDLGRSYEAVIRVNSQSGKGGISYLLESEYGLELPRRLQIEFSQVVQAVMDATRQGADGAGPVRAVRARVRRARASPAPQHQVLEEAQGAGGKLVRLAADVRSRRARSFSVQGAGNGPIDAFVEGAGRGHRRNHPRARLP